MIIFILVSYNCNLRSIAQTMVLVFAAPLSAMSFFRIALYTFCSSCMLVGAYKIYSKPQIRVAYKSCLKV